MQQSIAGDSYKTFSGQREKLASLLGDATGIIEELSIHQFRETLRNLQQKVQNDSFKIMVVGTFKNGKSTFINSFLGEEILPAYSLPATAVINEVKYGEKKRAVLHFRDPLPQTLPHSLPDRSRRHMEQHGMNHIPPLEIPCEEIEDYVVIPMGKDPQEMLLESPYEKLELFWPLELLQNGVVIIDSPGLNEHATRTKVTMDYLTQADAILMILNAQALCSKTEMDFIENDLKGQGFSDPFFLINRFDTIPMREQEKMKQYAFLRLKEFTSFGNEGIHFVSSMNALDGKLDGDEEKLEGSGIPQFERQLSKFLTREKGKGKLAQPARELKQILNQEILYKLIPMQRKLLHTEINEIKERYEKAKPQLEELTMRKEQLHNRLALRIEQSRHEFRRVISRNVQDLIDLIPVWVEEYEPATKLGVIPSKEKTAAVVKEISDELARKCTEQQTQWRTKVLGPMVEEKAASIFESAESDVEQILNGIDQIQVDISGGEINANPVPTWQRVVGLASGVVLGDLGLAAAGGMNGLSKELAKTAALEFGAGFVLSLLGLFNPITIAAVLVGAFFLNWKQGQSNAMQKLRSSICDRVITALEENKEESVNKTVASIADKFNEIVTSIISSLDAEIQEVDNQVKGIIAEMEKGQENVEKRETVIDGCEAKIKALSSSLDELIFQLVKG